VPDADLIPGFFGKLPATGDFVSRGLPSAFTAAWDRWLARHLATRLPDGAPPLFFHRAGPPQVSGVVLPSRDRAGRRFPLTLAATGALAPEALAALAEAGAAAIDDALPPDALAGVLAQLDLRGAPTGSPPPPALLLWADAVSPREVDPDAPGPVLDMILGLATESGP
jgi:type VI secretion system protein ImpM